MLLALYLAFAGVCLAEDDYVFAQPGDSGADVELALSRCAELGFLKNLPAAADVYLADYEPGIMEMEKALGLTADGILHLKEYEEIEFAIFQGAKGNAVKEMLEWLYELGYIREKLPEPHDVYEKKYVTAVRNAEKRLGLTADGVLTGSEQQVIRAQPLPAIGEISRVNLKRNQANVTVSWNGVKGGVSYAVYRDGKKVKVIEGKTSWTDEDLPVNRTYSYKVQPLSYLQQGQMSRSESIKVPILYLSVTLRDIHKSGDKYTKSGYYVKLGNMKYISGMIIGRDSKTSKYSIEVRQQVNGRTYFATLILENYRTWSGDVPRIHALRFKIKNISGQGRVQEGGSHPVIILNDIHWTY